METGRTVAGETATEVSEVRESRTLASVEMTRENFVAPEREFGRPTSSVTDTEGISTTPAFGRTFLFSTVTTFEANAWSNARTRVAARKTDRNKRVIFVRLGVRWKYTRQSLRTKRKIVKFR